MAVVRSTKQSDTPKKIVSRNLTLHSELVRRAERWLRLSCGCGAVLSELSAYTPTGEIPDAIGWRSNYSVLVECKATRRDFLVDRKKLFRRHPKMGVGDFRFYLCPPKLIAPEELPEGWGLLYAHKHSVRMVHGPQGNIWTSEENQEFSFERQANAEIALLASAVRRSQTNAAE